MYTTTLRRPLTWLRVTAGMPLAFDARVMPAKDLAGQLLCSIIKAHQHLSFNCRKGVHAPSTVPMDVLEKGKGEADSS